MFQKVPLQKQGQASPAAVVVQKEQPRIAPVAATQVQAPVRCRSVPLDLNASNMSAAPRNVSAKKCLSDPIVTPVTDEFPTEDTVEWVAPKQIIALERRHFVRRDDCLDGTPHKGDDRVISNPIVTPCTDEYPTLSEGEREAFLKETTKAKEEVKPPQPHQFAPTPAKDMNTQASTTITPIARSRPSNERTNATQQTNATQVAGSTEANRSKGQHNSKEQVRKKGKRKSRRARDTKRDKKEKSKGLIETITKILKPCSKRSHSKKTAVKE
ncbi:hypothetical protein ANCCAN_20510 [Ancylostoma caninum]|uniref:Uncharacterized protein n=1 Tax=Ancylostoma caninum TaxID=29170 RepID=A0A368FRJ6_ANCCA|nr:hypothetical protein ANCCAN_20510 [Ancylostoma caninum]